MSLRGVAVSLVDHLVFGGLRLVYRDREVTHRMELREGRYESSQFFQHSRLVLARSERVPLVTPCDILETPLRKGWRQFAFQSPMVTPHPKNNLVLNRYYPADAPPERPIILFVPPYRIGNWMAFHWIARLIAANGFPVILTQTPYHMDRQPKGSNPGEHLISADLKKTIRGFRQGIKDLVALINFVQSRGRRVGLMGISLGSILSAYTLCSDDRPEFAVLIAPVVRPIRSVWSSSLLAPVRANIERLGYTYADLVKIGKLFNLTNYEPAIDTERILICQAAYDQVVSSTDIDRLAAAWAPVQRTVYDQGHLSICVDPALYRDIFVNFLTNFR